MESALPINLSAMEGSLFINVLSNFEINILNNNSKDMAIPNRLSPLNIKINEQHKLEETVLWG